eukprot:TRINITY_DN17028_c0_g1_i2.p1 TRINITY_DN17028_c0_g1~~TRINITY_DN17028_c0_g1_i2.p1  ORF type:complete len:128 (+),score=23.96 TRINITY_DN17028_c0_g1_i2:275-658(+)
MLSKTVMDTPNYSLEGDLKGRFLRLKTDHISFNPPAHEKKFQAVIDKSIVQPPYSGNFPSLRCWEEKSGYKTVNNRSSVIYNIISNSDNTYSGAQIPVSYTHLTLPTILLVQISVVAVSLKKKKQPT